VPHPHDISIVVRVGKVAARNRQLTTHYFFPNRSSNSRATPLLRFFAATSCRSNCPICHNDFNVAASPFRDFFSSSSTIAGKSRATRLCTYCVHCDGFGGRRTTEPSASPASSGGFTFGKYLPRADLSRPATLTLPLTRRPQNLKPETQNGRPEGLPLHSVTLSETLTGQPTRFHLAYSEYQTADK